MTQDEIISSRTDVLRMAREAGLIQYVQVEKTCVSNALERFAALVAEPWIETNKALAKEIIEMKKQAEQEPVAWMDLHKELGQLRWAGTDIGWDLAIDAVRNRLEELYAAPVRTKDPCHPWQDLTDDEVMQTHMNFDFDALGEQSFILAFARAVIAADREKNK